MAQQSLEVITQQVDPSGGSTNSCPRVYRLVRGRQTLEPARQVIWSFLRTTSRKGNATGSVATDTTHAHRPTGAQLGTTHTHGRQISLNCFGCVLSVDCARRCLHCSWAGGLSHIRCMAGSREWFWRRETAGDMLHHETVHVRQLACYCYACCLLTLPE